MVANFVRVLASGAGLFLATTTTTTLVKPAYGLSSASTADPNGECAAERAACHDDAACLSCVDLQNSSSDEELNACIGAFITGDGRADESSSTSSSCRVNVEFLCCMGKVSDLDCLDNDDFVDYNLCAIELLGCSGVGEITCDGFGDSTNASSGTVAATDNSGTVAATDVRRASIAAGICALFVALLPFS